MTGVFSSIDNPVARGLRAPFCRPSTMPSKHFSNEQHCCAAAPPSPSSSLHCMVV